MFYDIVCREFYDVKNQDFFLPSALDLLDSLLDFKLIKSDIFLLLDLLGKSDKI